MVLHTIHTSNVCWPNALKQRAMGTNSQIMLKLNVAFLVLEIKWLHTEHMVPRLQQLSVTNVNYQMIGRPHQTLDSD